MKSTITILVAALMLTACQNTPINATDSDGNDVQYRGSGMTARSIANEGTVRSCVVEVSKAMKPVEANCSGMDGNTCALVQMGANMTNQARAMNAPSFRDCASLADMTVAEMFDSLGGKFLKTVGSVAPWAAGVLIAEDAFDAAGDKIESSEGSNVVNRDSTQTKESGNDLTDQQSERGSNTEMAPEEPEPEGPEPEEPPEEE